MDFSYEVSRSISACQGVLLIVDANQVEAFLNLLVSMNYWELCARMLLRCSGQYFVGFFFKGIQAQTVANFYLAFEAQLAIIPVINKVKKKDPLLVIYSYS